METYDRLPSSSFEQENSSDKSEKFLSKIREFKDKIAQKMGLGGEELTKVTDEALVDAARDTISSADQDGERTDEEKEIIHDAVSSVVVQGAMETAGYEQSSGENPIISLDQEETEADLVASIATLHKEEVALPTGEDVAELAVQTIEDAKWSRMKQVDRAHGTVEYIANSVHEKLGIKAGKSEVVSDGRLGNKLRALHEMGAEQVGSYVIFPRSEITCDRDHIEGQKLNLYDKSPAGRIEVSFKLREGTDAIYDKFSSREDTTKYDAISCWYMSNGQAEPYALCGAISFKRGDVKVFISEPDTNVRTAHGLVKIEAPSEMPAEEIEKAVADIMENDFGISDALNEVPAESEEDYKRARYAWEHRIYEMHTDDYEAAGKLESSEVAPGYATMIEPGKHKEYEAKYGEMCAYHVMYSEETSSIVATLTSGLLCSSERYQRGIFDDGMSTPKDLKSGGGDSVFTRVSRPDHARAMMKTTILFKPELFDRTDWYAYDRDRYGSTEDDEYQQRLTPDQLFSRLADGSLVQSSNEQMFRTGIGPDYIQEIRVNPAQRDEILAELRAQGVAEIGGRSIEDIVVANENYVAPRPVDPSMEEDWGDDDIGNLETTQQSSAQTKEGILAGTIEYPGVEGIFDVCETPDDVTSLFDAVAKYGQKDKLKTDLSMFIIDNIKNGIIGSFLEGGLDPLDINAVIMGYAQDKLGIDLNFIIETKQKWNK